MPTPLIPASCHWIPRLRTAVSRIRLWIAALGCAILCASLFAWAQSLHATEDGYIWVGVDTSSAPAAEAAEIWQTSASCLRPFFVKALLRSKAKLSAYYQLAPEEIRAWRNRQRQSDNLQASADQKSFYRLVSGEQDASPRDAAQMEYDATLHVQHAEWYATVSKLTIEQSQWEQRLNDVADERVILSEAARKGFKAYSGRDFAPASAKGDFEHYVLFLLGVGGFSSDEEQAIKLNCVNVIPVKRVFNNASLLGEIWRWPFDHIAAFSLGLELVLVSMLFVPIVLWITTGDLQLVKRHFRDAVEHFVTAARTFHKSDGAVAFLHAVRTALMRARAFLIAFLTASLMAAEQLLRESRTRLGSSR